MTLKALVSQRLGFSRFSVSAFIGAFCGVAVVCGPAERASAQVIEIGAQGALTVYDGPAVFTANRVAAIRRPTAPTGPAPRLTAAPPHLRRAISDAAQASDLSAALIAAIAWRESNFKALAVSRAGAVGEMQLLPRTARQLGVDPRVSRQNVAGGAAYVRALLRRYDGDLIKTLAAYNAGPEAVDRYGGVPPFKETKAYVAAVLDRLSQESLAGGDPMSAAAAAGVERATSPLVVSESGR